MARGIAFGVGAEIGKVVRKYFEVNPCPPYNLNVDRVDIIDDEKHTFIDLLRTMLQADAKNLVVVVHGLTTGKGLSLELGPGGAICKGEHLQTLMDIGSKTPPSAGRLARLNLSEQSIKTLLDLMKQIRDKRLGIIEWRSCDLGAAPEVLKQFHLFCGATTTGAPKSLNIFGVSPVLITPFDKIPSKYDHGYIRHYYPDKWKPTVINYLKLDPVTSWPIKGILFAETKRAVQEWVTCWINPAGNAGTEVPVHALWKENDPNSPLADPVAILPLSFDYNPGILYATDAGGFPITYTPHFFGTWSSL